MSAQQDPSRFRLLGNGQRALGDDAFDVAAWNKQRRAERWRANLEIADLEGARLAGADLEGADLEGVNLRSADLNGANLERSDLKCADLQSADLRNADLTRALLCGVVGRRRHRWQSHRLGRQSQGANLKQANLLGANLQSADLRNANLEDANLEDANLEDANLGNAFLVGTKLLGARHLHLADFAYANLRGANLQNANLSEIKGLFAEQLGDTILTGAKLPAEIAQFRAIGQAELLSKLIQKNFLAVTVGCVFSWITILTAAGDRETAELPLLAVEVPIAKFSLWTPAILIALYVYLLLFLQRLWETLAGLPAVFVDGLRLDERVYPLLPTGHVLQFFKLPHRPHFWRTQVILSTLLVWVQVPATVLWMTWNRLPIVTDNQASFETWVIVLWLVLSFGFGIVSYWRMVRTLQGHRLSRL